MVFHQDQRVQLSSPTRTMILLSWNCQGLKNPSLVSSSSFSFDKVKAAQRAIFDENPSQSVKNGNFEEELGFNNCFVVDYSLRRIR